VQTYETELIELIFTPENVIMASQEHGFITSLIFKDLARKMFFPDIAAQNARLEYDSLHSSSSMDASVIHLIVFSMIALTLILRWSSYQFMLATKLKSFINEFSSCKSQKQVIYDL
jgi:hypothetical protein